jgi:hypothetical protein
MFVAVCSLISPVIAVPLGQTPAKRAKKDSKAVAPAKSQETSPIPPVPSLPSDVVDVAEPLGIPDVPDIPEPSDTPEPELVQAPGAPAPEAPVAVAIQPAIPGSPAQSAPALTIAPVAPEPPPAWGSLTQTARVALAQDDKRAEPVIPETELINLLVDVVKRDADPNVRNEALQGLCRVRTDAGINALIQLYDGSGDVKVKGEIIRYLLRRESRDSKVDNSKAIAKLTAIAKSEQNEELRNRAIAYLGNVKGDDGANILIQIYDTLQDQKMKQYVIRSLAQNRGRKAVDKLVQIAKNDTDPVVRQYAIRSLYNVDNQRYLELDRTRVGVGMIDGKFFTPMPNPSPSVKPFVFKYNAEPFEFDAKKWEEWQKDWQKNWEERNEKMREMIEKMQLDGKIKIDDLQNKLRIEMPKIEIQFKDLEDKIRLGYGFDNIGVVEDQLRSQLTQLYSMRAKNSDINPKILDLRDALEKQLNRVRELRDAATRNKAIRGKRVTSSPTPVEAPKVRATAGASSSSF